VIELEGASTRIRLYPSGILFAPFDPRPQDIRIEDVAHGLACINRFGGHLAEPYNVAHHSLLVSYLCHEEPLWALLHEVAEALSGMGDACGPTKRHPSLREPVKALERGIERAAAERFGLPVDFASAACVKEADLLAYAWEDRDLRGGTEDDAWVAPLRDRLPPWTLKPIGWRDAKGAFLTRFVELGGSL
jgi:hypothetical protein